MKIECLFIERDEPSGPELLLAWDEYTISENFEGWKEACDAAIQTLNGDFIKRRVVSVDISDEGLAQALLTPEISGEIVDPA